MYTYTCNFVCYVVMNGREKTRAKMRNLLLICTSCKILSLNVTIYEQNIYLPNSSIYKEYTYETNRTERPYNYLRLHL